MNLDNIYNQDCLEGMKQIPDASVDCIICDLPYAVLHKNNKHVQWDRLIPFEPLWEQYLRVAKPNAAIVLFCQGMFTAQLMMSQPKLWRYNLIWEKGHATGFLNANRMPMRSHEDIAIFYREQPTYNPQFRNGSSHPMGNGPHRNTNQCYGAHKKAPCLRIPSEGQQNNAKPSSTVPGQVYNYDHVYRVPPTGKSFPNSVLHFSKEHNGDTWHPTQKPVDLIRWLIRTYTNPGETILDNCMGSGTTAIACIKEHRHYLGFELNKEYFDKAMQRIQRELAEPELYFETP